MAGDLEKKYERKKSQREQEPKARKKKTRSGRKKTEQDFLLVSPDAPFQFQEAFNSLRTNLKFVSMNNNYKKIVVTSSLPNEGKSSIAINLGVSLAMDGSHVLLVDCDLRKPVLHRYLRVRGNTSGGLTAVLAGNINSVDQYTVAFRDVDLSVLPAGASPPNPAQLLGSKAMKDLIASLESRYDYIIFDTAPVSIVTDAAVLSQYADGVILVVRQKMATIPQVQQAKKNLEAVNANILGVVFNDFDLRNTDKSSGYYYNNYYYEYSDK